MKKEIMVNSTNEDTRIALLENGKLVEIFVERPDNERMVGDIYLGRVRRVVKGMQAVGSRIGNVKSLFGTIEKGADRLLDRIVGICRLHIEKPFPRASSLGRPGRQQ